MKSEVYNNDSIKFLEEYKGERIHLVVTDPPYELPSWAGGGFMNEKTVRSDWINEMNVDNLSKSYKIDYYADLLYKAQGGKINAYFFCNKLQIPQYFKTYVERYKCKFDIQGQIPYRYRIHIVFPKQRRLQPTMLRGC